MDHLKLINEVKMSSNSEAKRVAETYGIKLSNSEINALRPLLDEISFHWLFTGIPESFIKKVQHILGNRKTEILLQMYNDTKQ